MQTQEWGRTGENYTFTLILSLPLANFQGFLDPGGICVFWISQIDSSSKYLSTLPLDLYKALSQQQHLDSMAVVSAGGRTTSGSS